MKKACLLVFTFVVILVLSSCAARRGQKIDDTPPRPVTEEKHDFNIGRWLVNFYGRHISPVDGDRCPSSPSCGSYSARVFQKHGFFMGWMMTVDRLIHEGREETEVSPFIHSEGKWKIYDPVENNDFWWYSGKGTAHE